MSLRLNDDNAVQDAAAEELIEELAEELIEKDEVGFVLSSEATIEFL